MAKKNMTIRIDDELREKLQLVADKELRPLANQVLFFIVQGLEGYLKANDLQYYSDDGMLLTPEEYKKLHEDDIPF